LASARPPAFENAAAFEQDGNTHPEAPQNHGRHPFALQTALHPADAVYASAA
jgi:hypothetical protein